MYARGTARSAGNRHSARELDGPRHGEHAAGRRLRRVLGDARDAVAELVGARPQEVVFTSGATEANQIGVLGGLAAAPPGRRVIVTTRAEHPSMLKVAERLSINVLPWFRCAFLMCFARL